MPLVLVLAGLSDDQLQHLRAADPEVRVERIERDDARCRELLPQAEVVIGSLSAEEIARAGRLRWLQLTSVGAGRHLERVPPHVRITCARGAFGDVVADHAFALLLALSRGLQQAARQTTWSHLDNLRSLRGESLLLLGAGDIGRHVARRAKAFGMRTLGVNRTGGDAPEGIDELHALAALDDLLPRSRCLVNALPDTPETRGLLDARRLALLPPDALVVNVGRGTTMDQPALVEALRAGRLGGAGLDVTEPEPLPPDHPLWRLPNVLITPHVGGAPGNLDAFTALAADNLRRFRAGQPLRQLVERQRGY